jgi:uncharacterized protein YgbK (DUF1537 family)
MIGVIADDLTGAAEMGAVGLRYGLRSEIIQSGKPNGQMDIVCFDTDTRSSVPEEAAKRAAAAARLLRAAGAKWIYKKVDSVLRGHVTAEVEAVMQQLKFERALLLPANPSLGRIIRDGQYFVRGKLIHKTRFAYDPEYPRRSSRVLRLLKIPEVFSIRVVNGDRQLYDNTIVVGEVETPGDVSEWAAISDANLLPAGGADFFNALLQRENPAVTIRKENSSVPSSGRELFVCGTSTEYSRRFVMEARRKKKPVVTLPVELIWGAEFSPRAIAAVSQHAVEAFNSHSRVILAVGLPLARNTQVAKRFFRNVVQVARSVMNEVPIARVYAEGGATASELVHCMNWSRLIVENEPAPGVATLSVGNNQSTLLTIKPGTYAWPEQWTE